MSLSKLATWALCGAIVSLMVCDVASAQRRGRGFGFGGGFGGGGQNQTRYALATLEAVQTELKLTDEQKTAATDTLASQREQQQELFQGGGGGGDFAAIQEKMTELRTKLNEEFLAKLDDDQKARLTGLFIQVVGTNALQDAGVQAALEITDEQKEGFTAAQEENQLARQVAFEGFQDMSQDERQELFASVREDAEKSLLAVLTDDQKKKFEELKGEEIEIDVTSLRRGRGRGRGFGGRGRGGRRGGNN